MNAPTAFSRTVAVALAAITLFSVRDALAHCDTMDGPIVPEAQAALESGDVMPVLKWVSAEDEEAIRDAFRRTRAVRDEGGDVREIADRLFLETLIRVHRQGEGESFTGLKPSGTIAPAFVAADAALGSGNAEELVARIASAVQDEIRRRFDAALERRTRAGDSVEAGRAYVEAYVTYLHFVEELHGLLGHAPSNHVGEPAAGHTH
jgi:hypothetical protein